MHYLLSFLLLFGYASGLQQPHTEQDLLFRNIGVVNTETGVVETSDVLVSGGKIEAIGQLLPKRGLVIDGSGKYLLPGLTSAHVHVGTLRGNAIKKENYTRDNILRQLKRYQEYGITQVLSMGTDQPLLFNSGLYDSLAAKQLPGAQMFSAGYGFAVKGGTPGSNFPMEHLFHPADAAQASREIDSLAAMHIRFVKIWVDDAGQQAPKLSPAIYQHIIAAAHRRQMKVVAHAYTLNDARQLVAAGVDVLGHSIRDSLVDAPMLKAMKEKKVVYIPTLTLDIFATAYAGTPEWINDPFFLRSLEPGVNDMLRDPAYAASVRNSPVFARNQKGVAIARQNLLLIYQAGIRICLGTDSGALPIRAQGFAEHLEMEKMVEAGMPVTAVLLAATRNGAALLGTADRNGSIRKGMDADLLVLAANPLSNIKNGRQIDMVCRKGVLYLSKNATP